MRRHDRDRPQMIPWTTTIIAAGLIGTTTVATASGFSATASCACCS